MKIARCAAVLLLLSLIQLSIQAKGISFLNEDDSIPRYSTVTKATLKLNLPCLIDPLRQSLLLGTDIRLGPKLTTDVALGWYFNGESLRYDGEKLRGGAIRLGLKYYYLENRYVKRSRVTPYFGVEAKFNKIFELRFENICRYGCQYTEIYDMEYERTVMGFSAKYGLHLLLGKQRKLFFDFYGGIGGKVINLRRSSIPVDARSFESRGFLETPIGRQGWPDVLLGIYFGYRFL